MAARTKLSRSALRLLRCEGDKACGLVQLAVDAGATPYPELVPVRVGQNARRAERMVDKVAELIETRPLKKGDVVVDIGSNDGTLLNAYDKSAARVGVDPNCTAFAASYADGIAKVPVLFGEGAASLDAVKAAMGGKKAKIVTSISVLDKVRAPLQFVKDVASILADDGVWHVEQRYLPSMMSTHGYDNVCHDHLGYFSLSQIVFLLDRVGMKVLEVSFDPLNGGTIAVTATKGEGHADVVPPLLAEEAPRLKRSQWEAFGVFSRRHKEQLPAKLFELKSDGARVMALGASCRANVLLQVAGIDSRLIEAIGDNNPDKIGKFTPGSLIPIIAEAEAFKRADVMLVLPWSERAHFVAKNKAFLARGGKLLFPLPDIDLATA